MSDQSKNQIEKSPVKIGPDTNTPVKAFESNANDSNKSLTESPLKRKNTAAELVDGKIDSFGTSGGKANWISYLVAFTIGVEAITIGYNLAVGPIFLKEEQKISSSMIGLLFFIGNTIGTVISVLFTMIDCISTRYDKILPQPVNLYKSMTFITVGVLIVTAKPFVLIAIGVFSLMSFNELASI